MSLSWVSTVTPSSNKLIVSRAIDSPSCVIKEPVIVTESPTVMWVANASTDKRDGIGSLDGGPSLVPIISTSSEFAKTLICKVLWVAVVWVSFGTITVSLGKNSTSRVPSVPSGSLASKRSRGIEICKDPPELGDKSRIILLKSVATSICSIVPVCKSVVTLYALPSNGTTCVSGSANAWDSGINSKNAKIRNGFIV